MSDRQKTARLEIARAMNQWKKGRWDVDTAIQHIENLIEAKVREVLDQEKQDRLGLSASDKPG